MIMDHDLFMLLVPSLLTLALCVPWLIYDIIRWRRFWPDRKERHDEVFASYIGGAVALLGIVGVIRYHL